MKESSRENSFRARVFVLWVVQWNMFSILSIWTSGSLWHRWEPIKPLSRQFLSAAFFGNAAIPLAILLFPTFRTWALHPNAQFSSTRKGLWVLVAFFGAWGTLVALPLIFRSLDH